MIHVNLLSDARSPEATRHRRKPQRWLIDGASVTLVACAAAVMWWLWSLQQRSLEVAHEIRAAQQQTERLKRLQDDTVALATLSQRLRQRVALIEDLHERQHTSRRVLQQLSRSVPDRMWLLQVEQEGPDVQIQGLTTSLNAVTHFVINLETSGQFVSPVESLDTRHEADGADKLVRFSLKVRFLGPPKDQL